MARVKKNNQKNYGANVGYLPAPRASRQAGEAELWQMADALRGSMDAAEYLPAPQSGATRQAGKHVLLGLIFLKYISDAFEEQHARLVDNVRESRTIAARRPTLLPKLISGEIRVAPIPIATSAYTLKWAFPKDLSRSTILSWRLKELSAGRTRTTRPSSSICFHPTKSV